MTIIKTIENTNLFNCLFLDMKEEIEAGEFNDYKQTFDDTLGDTILQIHDLEEALMTMGAIFYNTEDEVLEYIDFKEYDMFHYDIDEDFITIENVPEFLRGHIEELVNDFCEEHPDVEIDILY